MRDINNFKGKIFRHFKGDYYLFVDIAIHSETNEQMVIYKCLYGNCDLYVRPLGMFLEEVDSNKPNPTGQKYRFEEVYIKSIK